MLGCDVVEIARIKKILAKNKIDFLNKIFSKEELEQLNQKAESIAGYYAVKEAASKALGCGIGKECGFKDIKIFKDANGKPFLDFSKKTKDIFKIKGSYVSISHDAGVAMAVVIIKMNE